MFVASLVAVLRERPSLKHFGPLLLVWGLAMLMLIFIRDLGSSLMFFGGFLVLLYVATEPAVAGGRRGDDVLRRRLLPRREHRRHVHDRVEIWLDTFSSSACTARRQVTEFVNCQGYQIAQSLFAQADGGLFGQGFGKALLEFPGGAAPARGPHRPDLRGDRQRGRPVRRRRACSAPTCCSPTAASRRRWSPTTASRSCWPSGLTAVFALQVFVIVGGVTRVIPLTGVTLPFVSYGGSSIVANMVLLALLLIVSDHARAERLRRGGLV